MSCDGRMHNSEGYPRLSKYNNIKETNYALFPRDLWLEFDWCGSFFNEFYHLEQEPKSNGIQNAPIFYLKLRNIISSSDKTRQN